MINIIYKILTANDAEQHKDDNNDNNGNAIKYLESNKDSLSDLVKKNYENLLEALTNNAIDIATSASSSLNSTLLLAQSSSSTFSNSFDQIDTFRKEESKRFDNNKGDIAEWYNNSLQ